MESKESGRLPKMTTEVQYIHLQVHSEFSIEDSLLTVSDIASLAKKHNMPAAAVTDVGNVFALVKFYQEALKHKVKPIIGAEVRIKEVLGDAEKKALTAVKKEKTYRLLLLCQNRKGFLNLSKLMTRAFVEGHRHGVAHIDRSWLNPESAEGLIAIEPGSSGFCAQMQVNRIERLSPWFSWFPNRYYFGIHRLQTEASQKWEQQLRGLASQKRLPIVALNAVCFAGREDHQAHEVRACIQSGLVLDAREGNLYSPEQYWKSQAEMVQLFADLPHALQNSVEIAKRCNVKMDLGQVYLPDFPVSKGVSLAEYLERLSVEGLENRLKNRGVQGRDFSQKEYEERLNIELEIIAKMGFPGYFLIVADFISWAKRNDIAVGPGRGSGAGSLVAYALGITDIDPLPHGLLFERFLNPERVSMPDFDVDFCMINRDKVINYVAEYYGKESVAQISTHGSMAAKASVRDVGRVMAHPYGFVDKIAKLIPLDLGITLPEALKQAPDLKIRYQEDTQVKELLDMAITLEGRVRNVGRHAGGVVIAPGKISDFCPLYKEEGSVYQSTHFDMGDIEKAGLVKFDFLGLRTLTIIDTTVKSVAEYAQKKIEIENLPLQDEKTFRLLQSCKTTAVFQLESRGFQDLIGRLLPDCFADIVALVALYRPGPLQSGMVDDFIDRKHGRAKVIYLHPCLEEILQETYGVIVYQEQVMQIAQVMAGYTLGAADLLRRAMGKKKPEEMAKQRDIFIKGSQKNNIDIDVATKVFDLMEMFAGYGFNKSHSVAYAMISYQTAYLKAHWLDYFMASVLSSDMDNTDKVVHYINDCKAFGLAVLQPCVNNSRAFFHVEKRGCIRFGLGAIKGVGEGFALEIEKACKDDGPYKNLLDFCIRLTAAKVNKKVLEALIWGGALDVLGQDRGVLLASIEMVLSQKDQHSRNQSSGQGDLFSMGGEEEVLDCQYAQGVRQWGLKNQLSHEFKVLGMYFSGHPLDPYRQEIRQLRANKIANLRPSARKTTVKLAGLVGKQKRMTSKSGRLFVLVELIDDSGALEIACFDEKMQALQLALSAHEVVVIEGHIQEGKNGVRFNPSRIIGLEQYRQMESPTLHIKVRQGGESKTTALEIGAVLRNQQRGESEIIVWYEMDKVSVPLRLEGSVVIVINETLLDTLSHIKGVDGVKMLYE